MGWKPSCLGLLFGLAVGTLLVGISSCGAGPAPTFTPAATATRAPTPTAGPFQLTAQAQYRQQIATQEAVRALACDYIAEIYRAHGQPFDPTKDPELMLAEVRTMQGLADPNARNSYGGNVVDSTSRAMVQRCTAR